MVKSSVFEHIRFRRYYMKKAVITLLGMIGHTKVDYRIVDNKIEKVFVDIPKEERAIYEFSKELDKFSMNLKQERYINTLPLLIDVFSDRDIIPIATQTAKDVQIKTLKFLEIKSQALENTLLIDESNYESIFQQISELLQSQKYESFIIDLTHGFRHLPILMIVNLIIASMKDIDKIEHILFAKEKVPRKKYKIIDLMDYTDLAKLSFVLENFNLNYTVGNKLSFRNEKYQDLVDSLRIISGHILANSLKRLIDNNLVHETIKQLEKLQKKDKKIATFATSINNIFKHLEEIKILKDEKDYIKLFKLSQMMKEREYLLNSITLLNESIGLYCAEKIGDISKEIRDYIDLYNSKISSAETKEEKKKYNIYRLSSHSKNIIKLKEKFQGSYLDGNQKSNIKEKILEVLKTKNHIELSELIEDVEELRNNLAHGNSSEEIKNVKGTISRLLKEYQEFIKVPNEIDIEKKTTIARKKREKIIPKGIDAPKDKIDELTNLFGNR